MVFKNIGNFGKKIAEYNAQRREINREKLRTKAQNAEGDMEKLEEEKKLRQVLVKHDELKQEVKQQRTAKMRGIVQGFNKIGAKFQKQRNKKDSKFDILGGNNTQKSNKLPQMTGNQKFKF